VNFVLIAGPKFAEKGKNPINRFDSPPPAIYVFVTSGSADARGDSESKLYRGGVSRAIASSSSIRANPS
jgi:hypothetical protein